MQFIYLDPVILLHENMSKMTSYIREEVKKSKSATTILLPNRFPNMIDASEYLLKLKYIVRECGFIIYYFHLSLKLDIGVVICHVNSNIFSMFVLMVLQTHSIEDIFLESIVRHLSKLSGNPRQSLLSQRLY